MKFDVLTTVNITFSVLDMTPYSLADACSALKIEAAYSSEKLSTVYQTTRRIAQKVVILLFHCYLEVFEVKSGSEKNL
jgi:hypothetical protein